MQLDPTELERVLRLVEAGRFDALSDAQVAALEAALDASPELAARVGAARPASADRLAGGSPVPSAADWGQVWTAIESAPLAGRGASRAAPASAYRLRNGRVGAVAAALAAGLILAALWRPARSSPDVGWTFRPADEVEVHELEVYGGDSSFLIAGARSGSAIIWVIEEGAGI